MPYAFYVKLCGCKRVWLVVLSDECANGKVFIKQNLPHSNGGYRFSCLTAVNNYLIINSPWLLLLVVKINTRHENGLTINSKIPSNK